MTAGSWTVYSHAALEMSDGTFDLGSDTYFIILATTSYSPNANSDSTYADVSSNEVSTGGGYTSGGIALTSVTNTLSTATVTFTAASPTWSSFSATFRYGVIIRCANGTSLQSTDKLLCYSDLGGGSSVTGGGGTLTVSLASNIFTITHSP